MEPGSPMKQIEGQSNDRIETHYPPSYTSTLADTLYNHRRNNDLLLDNIVKLTKANQHLTDQISTYQHKVPPFLIEWWKSKPAEEKLTNFLEGLSAKFEKQIDIINSKLSYQRGEAEVNQADYEEELQDSEILKERLSELEAKLNDQKSNNQQLEEEIAQLSRIRPSLRKQYLERLQTTTLMRGQSKYQEQQIGFIDSFYKDQPFITNKQASYFDMHQTFLQTTIARKERLEAQVQKLTDTVKALDDRIEVYLREKRQKEELKQKIIVMHSQVEAKKKQLEEYRIKTQAAEAKMKDLEGKLCEETMEKAIQGYNQLARKYQKLTERSLHLLGKSLSTPNLEGIERIVQRE